MLLRIDHDTRLTYSDSIIESVLETRMAPLSNEDQTVLAHKLKVVPSAPVTTFRDGFGNCVELFTILPPHTEVLMRSSSCVRLHRRSAARLVGTPLVQDIADVEATEFLRPSPLTQPTAKLSELIRPLAVSPAGSLMEFAEAISAAVRGHIRYEKKVTHAFTPVGDALELGQGVCQDFAHAFIAACRLLGIPARYASGYVNEPGEIATHAWCQIWGGTAAGWVDIDPTRGTWVADDYVLIGIGRDYGDVPPNRGVWKGDKATKESIAVAVTVTPVEQVPADLADLTAPAWANAAPQNGFQQQSRPGFRQQQRRQNYRQQQSQQQQ